MKKSWLEIDYFKIIKSVKKILEELPTKNAVFNKPNNKIPIIFLT